MVGLVLLLLLTWFVLGVLLAAWTLWFQAYIYNEPVEAIYWRAPVAGAVLTAFLSLWVMLDYRAPGRYRELHGFSGVEYLDFTELQVPNRDGKVQTYMRQNTARGQPQYLYKGRPLPSRPDKVTAVYNGHTYVFEPPAMRRAISWPARMASCTIAIGKPGGRWPKGVWAR